MLPRAKFSRTNRKNIPCSNACRSSSPKYELVLCQRRTVRLRRPQRCSRGNYLACRSLEFPGEPQLEGSFTQLVVRGRVYDEVISERPGAHGEPGRRGVGPSALATGCDGVFRAEISNATGCNVPHQAATLTATNGTHRFRPAQPIATGCTTHFRAAKLVATGRNN